MSYKAYLGLTITNNNMKSNNKILTPKVVAGGSAIPIGKNYYYMTGKKHSQGGIDIGKDPKTGLEVEDGEVMHLTNDEVKVFSSVPFLNGESPAEKVMNGDTPSKVFNAQEKFKDNKGINDDGSKKALGGYGPGPDDPNSGITLTNRVSKFVPNATDKLYGNLNADKSLLGANGKFNVQKNNGTILNGQYNDNSQWGNDPNIVQDVQLAPKLISDKAAGLDNAYTPARDRNAPHTDIPMIKSSTGRNRYATGGYKKYADGGNKKYSTNPDDFQEPINTDTGFNVSDNSDILANSTPKPNLFGRIGNSLNSLDNDVSKYYKDNPGALNDTVGIGSNIIGSIVASSTNNKVLDKMKYSAPPIARQATKLKTTININPQLDKMRETAAAYERDIDNNTASSRVALARKQRGRVASMLDTNDLYGNKENTETQLINQDKLNQQQISNANNQDYNQWQQNKSAFDNAILEKKAENKVGLIDNLNAGVQDFITRNEKRSSDKNNMLTIAAAHPNVNPRILKELGVTNITDQMIADWEKANKKTKS